MSRFSSRKFLHSQLCLTLPYPITKFTDKTIIVTGSNTGLGLEAARHFVRLDAARVILAVRSIERGKAAAKSIEESTNRSGVVDVWEMDLDSYASVQTFADHVNKELDLLHVVVENAGILTYNFNMSEEDERQITVNVVSTMLLALLLLPKLRETAAKINGKTVLTFTGSWMHLLTKFPEHKAENVFKELARKESARMMDRYQISKLLGLFLSRELADLTCLSEKGHSIVINNVNPGAVITDIVRNPEGLRRIYAPITQKLFCRRTEEGSRTLVHGAEGAEETHGQYLDDCKVGVPSAFVLSEEGVQTQKKMWKELEEKLERIHPGIMQNI